MKRGRSVTIMPCFWFIYVLKIVVGLCAIVGYYVHDGA